MELVVNHALLTIRESENLTAIVIINHTHRASKESPKYALPMYGNHHQNRTVFLYKNVYSEA